MMLEPGQLRWLLPRQRGYQTYDGGSLSVATDRYLSGDASYLRLKSLTVRIYIVDKEE